MKEKNNNVYGIIVHKTRIWESDLYVAYNPISKLYWVFKPGSFLPAVSANSIESAVMEFANVYVY